jgi:hypothetical protein
MSDEDEVVISKGQWEDYMAYDLFSIFVDGFDFNIKIEPKNIKVFEAFIESKKKQGAVEEFKRQNRIIRNRINEFEKSIINTEKDSQWCFENPEAAGMDCDSEGKARVENNELYIYKLKSKIEILKELKQGV